MEEHQIGLFIRDRRLELGMTQQQLADRLGITDKAVSKWERCVSYPDITLLRDLSRVLEVNVSELLAGQRDETPSLTPPRVEDVVLDTVSYAETARKKNSGWRFWLFAAVSAGCFIAALVLIIVYFALRSRAVLLAVKCVAFGWALCYPLLRTQHPIRGFLVILSATILPFLWQFVSPWQYFWAYGIALLSIASLWVIYFIWKKLLPCRLWMALGWSVLLGTALALVINQIVWGATGVRPDADSGTINTLAGGICFCLCLLMDLIFSRRRAGA